MKTAAAVTYSLDADGVGWIVFDDPTARANVFTELLLLELGAALDAAGQAQAVVIISAKETVFIAGADLKWIAALPDEAAAVAASRAGQILFQRIAEFSVPVVAAIHGACAGGGFELALACHWRIASDATVTQIGLPETSLGTIPGWGGCVRLPQLIGVAGALDHILQARLLPAHAAARDGLVDALSPAEELRAQAKAVALQFAAAGLPTRAFQLAPPPEFFAEQRRAVRAKTGDRYPALLVAIEVVERSVGLALGPALENEANGFGAVTVGVVCKNLLCVFQLREAARKRTLVGWFPPGAVRPEPIKRVGIVGAGVMGSGIAQWLAVCGYEVVLRDVQTDLLERGLGVIRGLFADAVQRGRLSAANAEAGLARIAGTTGWAGFATCELVIEAIAENTAAKRKLFSEIAAVVPAETLLASNTSALPIEEIAGHVPHPSRTLGLHFFNPVSRMPLVELIVGRDTSAMAAERALVFAKSVAKTPVICRSSPGFVVTRVLFFLLNEAVRLWEGGVPTPVLEAAWRELGWPMGPMRLMDEIGLDITESIFGEMAHYFPTRFVRTAAGGRLLAAGLKGRKNGAGRGFYLYELGREQLNDAETRALSPAAGSMKFPPEKIAPQLMAVMVDEARRCLAEGVVRSPEDIDFALLSGTGFPALHGGLLRYAQRELKPLLETVH